VTISSLALGAKKVIDAAWLHGGAYDLSSQAAFALESAQMLQSPETAAGLAVMQEALLRALDRVAALETERHSTNESLSEAAEALRVQRDRITELEEQVRLLNTQRGDVTQLIERERGEGEECVDIDDLTAALSLGSDETAETVGA
jgi:chromosome segregation ATPase